MSAPFAIDVHRLPDHVRVVVSGDVDLASASRFSAVAIEALGMEPILMVVDLQRVSFMDSSGLSVLVLLRRKARNHRGALRLVTNRRVDAVLKLAGLAAVFESHADVDEAPDGDLTA